MELRFERRFPAPPARVWALLTLPEEMNRWSEARVTAVTSGPDGDDSPGAVRRVTVPAFGLRATLDEVVLEAERPRRFVYRVTAGGGLRNHRGEITLEPDGDGTRVLWVVTFGAALPGLAAVLGAILRPRLSRSLDALGAHLARPPAP